MKKGKKTKTSSEFLEDLSSENKLPDTVWDALDVVMQKNFSIIKSNITLFLGFGISIFSLLNFSSDKYCDGNTATHFSCIHPSTYYYYETHIIFLFIVGIFLITFWHLKRIDLSKI